MQCPNCGAWVNEGEAFCGQCGTRVRVEPPLPVGIQPLPRAAPQRGMGTGAKIAIAVVLLLLLAGVVVFAFLVLGCGGCCAYFAQDAPFAITLDYPRTVKAGDKFTLRATVRNTGSGTAPLLYVGFGDSLLQGFGVLDSDPAFEKQDHLPTGGVSTFWYRIDIPPGQATTIEFHMQAKKAGSYSGSFTASSDPGSKITSMSLQVLP